MNNNLFIKIIKYLLFIAIISELITNCDIPKNNQSKTEIEKDSTIVTILHDNGNIFGKGLYYQDKFQIGKWDYFDKDGVIDKTIEYILKSNKSYVNQSWYYDKNKNDTIKNTSNFYKFNNLKQSYFLGDTISIDIDYIPLLATNSDLVLCLSENINDDFSNIENVVLDTITGKNMKVKFDLIYEKEGVKKLRGFLLEYYFRDPTIKDSVIHKKRKVYFDKKIIINKR